MTGDIKEHNSATLFYISDANSESWFKGVGDYAGIEFINNESGGVNVYSGTGEISKEKFKDLCVAWLELNYPEVPRGQR